MTSIIMGAPMAKCGCQRAFGTSRVDKATIFLPLVIVVLLFITGTSDQTSMGTSYGVASHIFIAPMASMKRVAFFARFHLITSG
jgi:hypothetical protein